MSHPLCRILYVTSFIYYLFYSIYNSIFYHSYTIPYSSYYHSIPPMYLHYIPSLILPSLYIPYRLVYTPRLKPHHKTFNRTHTRPPPTPRARPIHTFEMLFFIATALTAPPDPELASNLLPQNKTLRTAPPALAGPLLQIIFTTNNIYHK